MLRYEDIVTGKNAIKKIIVCFDMTPFEERTYTPITETTGGI